MVHPKRVWVPPAHVFGRNSLPLQHCDIGTSINLHSLLLKSRMTLRDTFRLPHIQLDCFHMQASTLKFLCHRLSFAEVPAADRVLHTSFSSLAADFKNLFLDCHL